MARVQTVVLPVAVENAAIKAVYELQYNTATAANFVSTEVPNTPYDLAIQAINQVARAPRKIKKSK